MSGGFGAVPDELHQVAGRIDDAVATVAGMVWQGPTGDYGHPQVQAAWASFLDDLQDEVDVLHRTVLGHGDQLRDTAARYREVDDANAAALEKAGVPGGGWAGGVRGVGEAPDPSTAWQNPGWAGNDSDLQEARTHATGQGWQNPGWAGNDPGLQEARTHAAEPGWQNPGFPGQHREDTGSGIIDPNIVRRAAGKPELPPDEYEADY
jgi:hypothetical protein